MEKVTIVTRKDVIRQTFKVGGHGGQKVNKTESGVRFIHPPSGARGESTESRYQGVNERIAFRRMAEHPVFKAWVAQLKAEWETGKTTDQVVAEQMVPVNLKVEYKLEGKWTQLTDEQLSVIMGE